MPSNKLEVIVLMGIQGSGKSTWAKEYIKTYSNFKRINRDSFRHMLSNYIYDSENEKLVTKVMYSTIEDVITSGFNIILDNMNLNEKDLKATKTFIRNVAIGRGIVGSEDGIVFTEIFFDVSLADAIARDKQREFSVGEAVIRKTYKKHIFPLKQLNKINVILKAQEYDPTLPFCVITDLDGTMALNTGTRSYYDYDESIKKDVVNPIVALMFELVRHSKYSPQMIAVSGREDKCKKFTEEWLLENNVFINQLIMRKEGDQRADYIVKEEIYNEYIKGKYNVLCVFDDRSRVCKKWVDLGLFLFDVSQDPYNEMGF